MSFLDIRINPDDIAKKIELAGGWPDKGEGATSTFRNNRMRHRFHILPETVESMLESRTKEDFAMANMKQRFALEDYPYVEVTSYNCKTMVENLLDALCSIGSIIGGMAAAPGQTGANDSGNATDSKTISDQISDFVHRFPELVRRQLGDAFKDLQEFLKNIPDFYYRKLPAAFAFKIPGAEVNNIYELPLTNADRLVSVHGDFGWDGEGLMSKMLSFAQGFVHIPFQPTFIPEENGSGDCPSITVQFPLFNDTIEHAKDNYKFIHTIIPWNMWVQWGLFTMPPVIYEVKPSCGMKLKWCTANINLSFQGAMREVDPSWKDVAGDVVTIPDVYYLTCTFKSLLDSNFNQYLLSFEDLDIGNIGENINEELKDVMQPVQDTFEAQEAQRMAEETQREIDELQNSDEYHNMSGLQQQIAMRNLLFSGDKR